MKALRWATRKFEQGQHKRGAAERAPESTPQQADEDRVQILCARCYSPNGSAPSVSFLPLARWIYIGGGVIHPMFDCASCRWNDIKLKVNLFALRGGAREVLPPTTWSES